MVHEKEDTALVLPPGVVGSVEVGRLIRELEEVDENLLQLKLRKSGSSIKMPKTSRMMEQIQTENELNLLHETDRKRLSKFLSEVKANSPICHISFSEEPSQKFLEQLTVWFRKEIHPSLLLTIGLQPNIGAGCILRSTNKYFNFSLQQEFVKQRDLLVNKMMPPGFELKAPAVEKQS